MLSSGRVVFPEETENQVIDEADYTDKQRTIAQKAKDDGFRAVAITIYSDIDYKGKKRKEITFSDC